MYVADHLKRSAKNMKKILTVILYLIIVISILAIVSKFLVPTNTALMASGGVIVYIIAIFLSGIILIQLRNNSPEAQKQRAEDRAKIKGMSSEDFTEFIEIELCSMFSTNTKHISDSLSKDLRIPESEVSTVLYDIGAIYSIPITDEDSTEIATIKDIVNLIKSRMY